MGLSFSVPCGTKVPPSLVNIYKEIENDPDIINFKSPMKGDLTRWAKQGILLLNASLTVQQNRPNSHADKWNEFTDAIICEISERLNGVVFMLWGNYAKKKRNLINNHKHLILEATHPSPLGANRGGWFGCRHFSKANVYLCEHGRKGINWCDL